MIMHLWNRSGLIPWLLLIVVAWLLPPASLAAEQESAAESRASLRVLEEEIAMTRAMLPEHLVEFFETNLDRRLALIDGQAGERVTQEFAEFERSGNEYDLARAVARLRVLPLPTEEAIAARLERGRAASELVHDIVAPLLPLEGGDQLRPSLLLVLTVFDGALLRAPADPLSLTFFGDVDSATFSVLLEEWRSLVNAVQVLEYNLGHEGVVMASGAHPLIQARFLEARGVLIDDADALVEAIGAALEPRLTPEEIERANAFNDSWRRTRDPRDNREYVERRLDMIQREQDAWDELHFSDEALAAAIEAAVPIYEGPPTQADTAPPPRPAPVSTPGPFDVAVPTPEAPAPSPSSAGRGIDAAPASRLNLWLAGGSGAAIALLVCLAWWLWRRAHPSGAGGV